MNQEVLTISVPEAGRRLGVGRNVAFRLAREGILPVLRLGRKLRVPVRALETMCQQVKPSEQLRTN